MIPSAATPQIKQRRAVGIVRVSDRGGRDGDSFVSPTEQRERIEAACDRDGMRLVSVVEEMDVSGGTALDHRAGLRAAVESVEDGNADVIVVAHFDRLVRSLVVQSEIVSRVEAAGGGVLALDFGQVTGDNGTAAQWLSGTMIGAVSEYYRRSVRERSGAAQANAIARGIPPWPGAVPGYKRPITGTRSNGRPIHGPLVPDPDLAPVVADAFRMRADGAPVREVRAHLLEHGISMSFGGVQRFLGSRTVLGELRFGGLSNLSAHAAIVDRDVWSAVQRVTVPRGRKAKSDRLLARLGVLRCSGCGARMTVASGHNGTQRLYRCPATSLCERRVAISADLVEATVVDAVKAALADVEGRASVEQHARDAEHDLERAQADLDAAIRAFTGLEDEQAARERLAELRHQRDAAQEQLDQLGGQRAAVTINAATDWPRLSLDAQRALIRATVERVTVAPGRGASRVTVELFGE